MKLLITEGQFKLILEAVVNPDWQPLYKFLLQIFGDKYLNVANGFLFMGKEEQQGETLWFYKNGMTRKTIVLDYDGTPYIRNLETKRYEIESFINAFNRVFDIYNDLITTMEKDGYELSDETKKDIYTLDYKEFEDWRNKFLLKKGYRIIKAVRK